METDPIMNITWLRYDELQSNWWNPNRMLKAEFNLLERSILSTGWVQPVLVNRDRMIIDGFHRWRMSQDSPRIVARYDGKLPVAILDVDEKTAMVMTVRLNRAKGTHIAVSMSHLVKLLIEEHECEPKWIANQIGASLEEVYLLAGKDIFAAKNVDEWQYSKAWYPA
jgi:ParB-like chromosome segregation protein Spo0J